MLFSVHKLLITPITAAANTLLPSSCHNYWLNFHYFHLLYWTLNDFWGRYFYSYFTSERADAKRGLKTFLMNIGLVSVTGFDFWLQTLPHAAFSNWLWKYTWNTDCLTYLTSKICLAMFFFFWWVPMWHHGLANTHTRFLPAYFLPPETGFWVVSLIQIPASSWQSS